MNLQSLSTAFKRIPEYGGRAFNQFRNRGSMLAHQVQGRMTELWTNQVVPKLNHRLNVLYIQPFQTSDAAILGIYAGIAATIMVIGITTLGIDIVAPSVAAGLASMLIGWTISRNQIKARFKREAANIVAQMVVIIEGAAPNQPRYQAYAEQRVLLNSIKFEHLKSAIHKLDKNEKTYRKHTQRLNVEIGFEEIKNTFLIHLRNANQELMH